MAAWRDVCARESSAASSNLMSTSSLTSSSSSRLDFACSDTDDIDDDDELEDGDDVTASDATRCTASPNTNNHADFRRRTRTSQPPR